jgi:hypothetical protein
MAVRDKLISIGENFIGFDKLLESEKKIGNDEIEIKIRNLDKLIKNEIQNRNEDNKKFKLEIENFVNSILLQFQRRINKKLTKIFEFIEILETRVITLERGMAQFRGELPSKLQVDTAALVRDITEFKTRLTNEELIWKSREEAVSEKMKEVMNRIFSNIEIIENNKINNNFQNFITSELAEIRNLAAIETETRKSSDDEIFRAIENYTESLQTGIRRIVKRH